MIYEHTMMFRLDTQMDVMKEIVNHAQQLTKQVFEYRIIKKRTRIRECGTRVIWALSFEFSGDDALMENLKDELWEKHEEIISTLTIPHQAKMS